MDSFKYIQDEDTFGIKYYEYGQAFFGSYKGMRYRVARDPMVNVAYSPPEAKADGNIMATVWPEPFSYDATSDEDKKTSIFPYTEEGKRQMTAWLNEQYETRINEWKKSEG